MMKPPPRTVQRWGIAVYRRGKYRSSSIPIDVSQRDERDHVYKSRAKARKAAARMRCLGLCATPIRVRVTVEAI